MTGVKVLGDGEVELVKQQTEITAFMTSEQKLKVLTEHAARYAGMDPKERKLEATKEYNQLMKQINDIWSNMSRKQKRKIMAPKMKYTQRVIRRLKAI